MVLFGVPGAFTPTCHKTHLPGFLKEAAAFKAKGVASIAVVAVNDPFVMGMWAKETGGEGVITFLADGNAEFAKAIGLDVDLSVAGLGIRCRRFSMLSRMAWSRRSISRKPPARPSFPRPENLLCQI